MGVVKTKILQLVPMLNNIRHYKTQLVGFSLLVLTLTLYRNYTPQASNDTDTTKPPSTYRELRVFTWASFFHPTFIKEFEKQHQCHLLFDYFDSNETMLAKILSGGAHYDVITPSSYMVDALIKKDLLSPLDFDQIPLTKHLDGRYSKKLASQNLDHAIPMSISYSGLGYINSRLSPQPTWAALETPGLKGRISLLNDYREVIGAALLSLGLDPNTTEPDDILKASQKVITWKKQVAVFDSESYKMGMSSGEFLLCHAYSGDIFQVQENRTDVGFFCPQEGSLLSIEEAVIMRTSTEKALAHKFMNALLEPKNCLLNMLKHHTICPNVTIYDEIQKQKLALTLTSEQINKSVLIEDLGIHNTLYQNAWETIRFAPQ